MDSKNDEKLERLAKTIQRKLDGNPALLVGSGGSVPYGLPSMHTLACEITEKLASKYQHEETWTSFTEELSNSNNLELALERVSFNDEIQNSIIAVVWSLIDKRDREAIDKFLAEGTSPALTSIIRKFVQCADATNIITTNYDRLIEYAIDFSQGITETGLCGNYIKSFSNFPERKEKRIVNLFKVHGSIDWFRHKANHNIISTSFSSLDLLSNVYSPMIVTPGNRKYKETHKDPFRTVMTEADKALHNAGSYLCIGYGFNDEHIQPIIIDENKNNNKPVVIVTKDVTPKIGELFLQNASCNCLIISENIDGGSFVYYSATEKETFPEDFWNVDLFYKLWFE